MRSMVAAFYTKPLIIYLVVALVSLSTLAGPAEAMFLPAAPHQNASATNQMSEARVADLTRIQTALESKIVQQKLMDYGLSPEETMARLNNLSGEQLHELAAHTDSIEAGGDAAGFLASVIILALLIVLLIFLVEGRIQIK